MTDLTIDRFNEFFRLLHGHDPYPWQERLAERAVKGDWPGAIDLPTGSGKTACIDIAVFALARQAEADAPERTAPLRIFFCVNRRVIVDEAYQRAKRIAKKICKGEKNGNGVLGDVAAALRRIAGSQSDGDTPPLDVLELRGGIYRDNRWARSITQPTIVCTTIDQLGSRLLFRGYGVSSNAAPIQAALIAYDSLILLDEAHISRPFLQTLEFVRGYLDPKSWAEENLGVRPAIVVPMTATPPAGVNADNTIRLTDADRNNESLKNRLTASKPAELRDVKDVAKGAVDAALKLAKEKPVAIGILVNRVATAKAVYDDLLVARNEPNQRKRKVPDDAVIELVIGSMRPIDRDDQADRLHSLVGPDRPAVSKKTSFVVATQCLEVGADYDFDVLVTECASLDALRQRFGRLNRAGRKDAECKPIDATAVVLAEKKGIKPDDKLNDDEPLDPIYGNALTRTWNWLHEHTTEETIDGESIKIVDFGIDAFDGRLREHGANGRIPADLLAPSASLNAPIMLPAYVDLWCQTAPRPIPDPDVALFLHGPQRGEPDVQVCWRADLVEDEHMRRDDWCDVVALLPPTSAECMSVPISRVRRWLANQTIHVTDGSDVLGVAASDKSDGKSSEPKAQESLRSGVLWRGVRDSRLIDSPDELRPGDTLVVPTSSGGWNELGHIPASPSEQTPAAADSAQNPPSNADSEGGASAAGTGEPTGTEIHESDTLNSEKNGAIAETDHATIDIAEKGFQLARDRAVLRLHRSLRNRLAEVDAVEALFDRAGDRDSLPTVTEWRDMLTAAAESVFDEPADLKQTLMHLACQAKGLIRELYPDRRGVVLMTRKRLGSTSAWFLPALDEGDDEPSRLRREKPVQLAEHTSHVVRAVEVSLKALPLKNLTDAFNLAARLHDLGKADERFQAMLRRTDRTDAWLLAGVTPTLLAKSDGLPMTRAEREATRRRAGLPDGFRHEMLSAQLVHCFDDLPEVETSRDLVLHLIAAHHGYARPFAPVVYDEELPSIELDGRPLSHEQRRQLVPPHQLDSGVAERFWSLTRRFGWWGLAYLEAVLRLADQQASAAEDAGDYENADTDQPAKAIA